MIFDMSAVTQGIGAIGPEYVTGFIGLAGVAVGGLITFGMQAWERHLTRNADRMSLVAEIIILATAIKVSYQEIHMPGAEYKISPEKIAQLAQKSQNDWVEAYAKLVRLKLTSSSDLSEASEQLIHALKSATNYLDPHSRTGQKTDFESADYMFENLEYQQETFLKVAQAKRNKRGHILKKRNQKSPSK